MGFQGADAAEILVGVEGVGLQLDDGHGDVGAVVGHALVVGQQVVEHEALAQGTRAGLETVHVVGLHLVAQTVDDLLQRLDPGGTLHIVVHKGGDGQGQHLPHGALHDLQLAPGLGGEHQILVVDLVGGLGDVHRVVGDTLEVGDGVEELADLLALGLGQGFAGDLHQVRAQLVLVAVDDGLRLVHLAEILFREFAPQGHSQHQVARRLLRHGVGHQAALLDGQGRVLQKALLQPVHVLLLAAVAGVGEQVLHQLFHQADARQQHDDGGQAEQGVHQGDGHGGHHRGQEGEVDDGVGGVEHQRPDGRAQHVDEQVDESGAPAVEVGAQGGQQHRHSRADGDAHDDGKGDLEGDRPGDGQGLQNTHGGGGALQHAGEHQAHQDAQQGVGEAGEDADERLALPQG